MKTTLLLAAVFASTVVGIALPAPGPEPTAAPSPVAVEAEPATTAAAAAPAAIEGNPFAGYSLYANPYYSSEVHSIAIPSMQAGANAALVAKASAVAKVPSFVWLLVDQTSSADKIELGSY